MDPDDERCTPGGERGHDSDGDGFDAIVAGWRSEGSVPGWPSEDAPEAPAEPPAPPVQDADEGHFVPPEPPPLPRIGPPAAVGLALLALGLVLVWAPGWVGVPETYGVPLGLLTLASGIGWLVLRLWPTPPEDENDDGAVV